MPAASPIPTLSQITAWSFDHLETADVHWRRTAEVWEDSFHHVRLHMPYPGGTEWTGVAAEAAQQRATLDQVKVTGHADTLRSAASIARTAASEIWYAKTQAIYAVQAAEQQGFTVREDLGLTDRSPSMTAAQFAARTALAEELSADIRRRRRY